MIFKNIKYKNESTSVKMWNFNNFKIFTHKIRVFSGKLERVLNKRIMLTKNNTQKESISVKTLKLQKLWNCKNFKILTYLIRSRRKIEKEAPRKFNVKRYNTINITEIWLRMKQTLNESFFMQKWCCSKIHHFRYQIKCFLLSEFNATLQMLSSVISVRSLWIYIS